MSGARDLDVVVHGASGFVGRLVAEHLARHAPAGVRIGLSGRSAQRVTAVRDGLGASAAGWPVIVADAHDAAALAALAGSTRVVATTVGPYGRYGIGLVEACARAGTSYADLTGEVLFVRESADSFDAAARASGARIVHACGYDSIPSDLAVLLTHQRAAGDGAPGLADVTLVASARGGLSGGTLDTMRLTVDTARRDPAARRLLADPYALSPDRAAEPDLGREGEPSGVHRDEEGRWLAPFVMAPFNTRVVRRSNALLGWVYGRAMRYREVMSAGRGLRAPLVAAGLAYVPPAVMAGMTFGPARALLDRVLPTPGQGPAERARREGWFRMDVRATTTSGAGYRTLVAGPGDPGYAATAVMLGQSALALALDSDWLPDRAGVLTPATALGDVLVDRLRTAGFTLTAEPR